MVYDYNNLLRLLTMSFSIKRFIGQFLPPFKNTVNIFNPDGTKNEIKVDITETHIPYSKENAEKTTDDLLEKVIYLLNYPKKVPDSSKNIRLLFLDSGSTNGSSLFSFDTSKAFNEKRLFLCLARDEDVSADTIVFYSIPCPKKIDLEFQRRIRECISNLITKSSYTLWLRAATRKSFMSEIQGNKKD